MPKVDPSEYDRATPLTLEEAEGGELLGDAEAGTPGMSLLRAKEMMRRMWKMLPPEVRLQLMEEMRKEGRITGGQLNDARSTLRSGR